MKDLTIEIKMSKYTYDEVVSISKKENKSISTVIDTAIRRHIDERFDFEHLPNQFDGYVKRVPPEGE